MPLPFDYARCANPDCALPCRRKEPGHPTYQSFCVFPGGDDCHAFLPNDEAKRAGDFFGGRVRVDRNAAFLHPPTRFDGVAVAFQPREAVHKADALAC